MPAERDDRHFLGDLRGRLAIAEHAESGPETDMHGAVQDLLLGIGHGCHRGGQRDRAVHIN